MGKFVTGVEAVSKNGFLFKVKVVARFNPEEYIKYFEELNRAPNAEIGEKNFFEIASKNMLDIVLE